MTTRVRFIVKQHIQYSKNSLRHLKGRGYNKNCEDYPRPLRRWSKCLLFKFLCVTQRWTLHVVI